MFKECDDNLFTQFIIFSVLVFERKNHKVSIVWIICLSLGMGPPAALTSLFNENLVKEGEDVGL